MALKPSSNTEQKFDVQESTHNETGCDDKCTSLASCIATKHVLDALVYYQSLHMKTKATDANNTSDMNDILVEYCTNKYKSLLDDYSHVVMHHSNDIELIHGLMKGNDEYKPLLSCAFASCSMYQRSNRNRENDDDSSNIFWRDFFEQIHSFILHSFDSGLRMKINHQKSTETKNESKDDIKTSDDSDIDVKLDAISNDILQRQKDTQTLDLGNNRFASKKFDLNMNTHNTTAHYNIGYTFYYWTYYKQNMESIKQYWFNQNDYLGYDPSQLYIEPKYASLKEELLNNGIQSIKPITYLRILEKAKLYLLSNFAKRIKAGDEEDLHYEIKEESPLKLQHLMCIILYTDLSDLSSSFSSTFRLLHPSETLSSIKNRNREYWNWSKLMRETVECYGELMGFEKRAPVYCGTDYMIISSYLIRLCSPTSTSKQLCVAYKFAADDGIVLQINGGSNYYAANLRYFDCSWISCYNDEDERLFCGGSWPLRVESVRLIKRRQNLKLFFKALFYLDCVVSGSSIVSDAKEQIAKRDKNILQKLIQHVLDGQDNKFVQYVNDSFGAFCRYKKQLTLNQRQIAEYLYLFKDIVFVSKEVNMINVEGICLLFKECKSIIVYDDENEYEFDVSEFLLKCDKCIASKDNKLEKIDVRVWRRDNDEDTWFRNAYGALDVALSNCTVSISKQTELNDENWDVIRIKSL